MPRSFLVKQHDKAQDAEKEQANLEQDPKLVSQHTLGLPPPLLRMSPRRSSPSLQRTTVVTDNPTRPIPKLVKIGDTLLPTKPLTEDYQTSMELEKRSINDSLNSTIDLRMRHHLPMLTLSPKELWTSQDHDSRTFTHPNYVDDLRRQMRYKNAGYDVREFFETPNSFPRDLESFYSSQQNPNCIEVAGKPFSVLSGKTGEGGYYGVHGTMVGPKGGMYPNPPLYSAAFYGSKENDASSQAVPRYYLPNFYTNFYDQDQSKDHRKTTSYGEIKAMQEPKTTFSKEEIKIKSSLATSTTCSTDDVKPQSVVFSQSGAPISHDVTVSKATVGSDESGTKTQAASNAKKYRYTCDVCGKSFSRSNTLTTHKRIHTGDKPFHCEQCGRAFRQPGNLTRHRLTHTAVKPYVCPQCNKAFNRASNLHTHMRTHTNYKPFVCDFCGKGFHQKIDMKIHRYTHTGEKPHKCTKCGRGFKQLTHLTYHMRTHSDERLYKCEYCGKGFNQKGNLQAHIYGHTGERPFKCDICDKGFTLASTLNTHKRTHATKKPFECQFCGKSFYQKNALKTHYIASHPFANGVSLL